MKKKVIVIILGLFLIGVNVYAAGDLVVNGKIGVGQSNPSSKLGVDATNAPTFEGNFTKTDNTFYNANSMQVTDSNTGGSKGTTALLFNLFHAAEGSNYTQNIAAMNASINLDGSGAWNGSGIGLFPFNAKLGIRNGTGDYDIDTVNIVRLVLATNPAFTQTITVDNLAIIKANSEMSAGSGTLNGTNWYGVYVNDIANNLGGSITANITNSAGLWMDKQTIAGKNYGLVLDGEGAGSDVVFGEHSNQVRPRIYSNAGQIYADDALGSHSLISPHDPVAGEWIFYSKNLNTGKTVRVNMEKLVKAVEKLTGETFMVETLMEDK